MVIYSRTPGFNGDAHLFISKTIDVGELRIVALAKSYQPALSSGSLAMEAFGS
jgi:hypothetical protein